MASIEMANILVVEDDSAARANMRDILELDRYAVRTAGSLAEAMSHKDWARSEVIILDRRLPDGLAEEKLPKLKRESPDAVFIIVTGHHDLVGAIACLKQGAEDYILKPLSADALRASLRRALEHRRARISLRDTEVKLRQALDELERRVEERTAELARANAELRAEIAVRTRAEKEMALLRDLALTIASEQSLDDAMRISLHRICEATGWDCGEAWLVPEGETALRITAHSGGTPALEAFHEASRNITFTHGEGLPGRVLAAREPIWVGNLGSAAFFSRAAVAKSCGLTAGLGVPIFSGEKVVAVVTFFLSERRPEDRRLVQLVAAAVAPLGPVIERKRVEDQLTRHKEHLELLVAERTAQLRQADRLASIGTLAAGLGHDIHNVLLPLRSRLDVIEHDDLPQKTREQLPPIRRAITYLQELSDGLHLLALDPADADATTQMTNLAEWWSQVGSLLGRTLPRRIAFQCSIDPNLPEVFVPPHRLTQAVLNLLVNAGEAIEDEGEVRLRAELVEKPVLEERRRRLMSRGGPSPSRAAAVRITVADTGEGMTDEVKRRALDPFFTTKKRGLGTGLGLSLVQGMVQQAGGTIEIESQPGAGTTFAMLLPARVGHSANGKENRPLATISVNDARVAGFIGSFLAAAGFDMVASDEALPRESQLWVLDPATARIHTAKRFLRISRKRSVIVVGEGSEEWRAIGATVVDDPSNVDALRRAIGKAYGAAATTTGDEL